MDFNTPISALNAFSVGMQVTANNIANISTDEFHSSRATFAEAEGSSGVRVASIQEHTQPGGFTQRLHPMENPETGNMESAYNTVEGSNTDLIRESVSMLTYQRGFEANAAVVRSQDQMTGTLLNMVV